jgi:ATP-binding cassette, subfamily B, bacterial
VTTDGDRHKAKAPREEKPRRVTASPWDAFARRSGPQSRGDLVRVLTAAVRLSWSADRVSFLKLLSLAVLDAAGAALNVLVAKVLFTRVFAQPDPADVVGRAFGWALLAVGVSVVVLMAGAWRDRVRQLFAARVTRQAQARVLDAAGSLDLEAFESAALHDALQRVTQTMSYRPGQVVDSVVSLAGGAFGVAGLVIALFALHPSLPLLVVVAQAPMWVALRLNARDQVSYARGITATDRGLNYVNNLLTGREAAPEIRAFGLVEPLRGRWERLSDIRLDELSQLISRSARRSALAQAGTAVGSVLTLLALVGLLRGGYISAASAGAAVVALMLTQQRLSAVSRSGAQLYESGLFLDDSEAFLRLAAQARVARPTGPAPDRIGVLRGEELTFRYPGVERAALDGVDIELRPGEVVALVGENGSGKTTLAKLLAHLYRPTSGRITWDGSDIAGADPDAVRRHISVLFQAFMQYQVTLSENITMGDHGRADDEAAVIAAAGAAGVDGIAALLPAGYGSQLGRIFEGGCDLSTGQWQRVALARAGFRHSELVILDEPTASLDPRAERALFDRIRTVFAGRTVLLISHRFSSVRSADRIYVLDHGRVIETGTHEQLIAQGGCYAELFSIQAAMYLGGDDSRPTGHEPADVVEQRVGGTLR